MGTIDMQTMDTTTSNQAQAFSIAASGRAFKILSDGLYSDKIAAVIRELSCNASDSHVCANKADTPFEVHLPTVDEPFFQVRDFGIGLSDADIYEVYTKYFCSTKIGNHALIGHLGLGSKSPFSLVREFEVHSTFNGEMRIYRMYFDASDTPRIKLMFNMSTTGENGVIVKFDVAMDQIQLYKDKAIRIFNWFKTTPIVYENGNIVTIDNKTKLINNTGWGLDSDALVNNQALAIMGNVAYPLDPSSVKNLVGDDFYLLRLPIVIRFDLGELEVAASREGIGYDDRTFINILAKVHKIAAEMYKSTFDQINNAKSKYFAHLIYNEIFGINSLYGRSLRNVMQTKEFKWGETKINVGYVVADLSQIYHSTLSTSANALSGLKRILPEDPGTVHRIKRANYAHFEQQCSREQVIVFDDATTAGMNRVKYWLKSNKKKFQVTICGKPTMGFTWDNVADKLGNPPVIWTSKLPKPPKAPKVAKEARPVTVALYDDSYIRVRRRKTENIVLDPTKGGFYVNYSSKRFVDKDNRTVDMADVRSYALGLGLIRRDTKIYVAKGQAYNKLKKLSNWIDFVDHIKGKTIELVNGITDEANNLATRTYFNSVKHKIGPQNLSRYLWDIRDTESIMKHALEMYAGFEAASQRITDGTNVSNVASLARELNIPMPKGIHDPEIDVMIKMVRERYPLLSMIPHEHWNGNFKHVNHYINLTDTAWLFFELSAPPPPVEED
jgi:hypothetical protein